MSIYQFTATTRTTTGSSAARRLRHQQQVPGIVYGVNTRPINIAMSHHAMFQLMKHENFHSSIVEMNLDGKPQKVLLRDFQAHPYKSKLLHMDFQVVSETHEMHITIPLHFINSENAPGVKLQHGIPSHVMIQLDIVCVPKDLPEFIEVDMNALNVGESIHAKDLTLPTGVKLDISATENPVICTILAPMKEESATTQDETKATEDDPKA